MGFLSVLILCHFRTSQPLPTVTPRACITCLFFPSASPLPLPPAHEHGSTPSPNHPAAGWVLFPFAPCKCNWDTSSTQGQQDRREVRMLRLGVAEDHPVLATASVTTALLGLELQREPGTLQDISPSVSCGKMPACKLMCLQCAPEPRWTLEFSHISEVF